MKPSPKTFHVKSFGCQMNVYDGDRMTELLGSKGMPINRRYPLKELMYRVATRRPCSCTAVNSARTRSRDERGKQVNESLNAWLS